MKNTGTNIVVTDLEQYTNLNKTLGPTPYDLNSWEETSMQTLKALELIYKAIALRIYTKHHPWD